MEILKKVLEKGFFTSEFARGLPLYALAFYAISKGHSPQEISDTVGALTEQIRRYQDTIVTVAALVAPLIDNLFYTKKRSDLKRHEMETQKDA